ncbi:Thiamine-binding protein domain-containing protein [Plasmodiophora brassicae]|uniref:Thiamine-binding protein domain-containing protein n=1 Tax=Plasmodiophora brassicae TaxID=37360 RepID=A0A0G4IYX0_PLABS|nr:hypothetical protein PBRA_001516 [Plasmodiophora brassicae]SPQ94036.1 unnamed protein product [Plasmodiophora brassicae]
MHVIADFRLMPIGGSLSMREHVKRCHQLLNDLGLETFEHACGTNITGEFDAVMNAIKQCHEKVLASGVARICTDIHVDLRTDKTTTLESCIQASNAAA